jgi:hypothetical protein
VIDDAVTVVDHLEAPSATFIGPVEAFVRLISGRLKTRYDKGVTVDGSSHSRRLAPGVPRLLIMVREKYFIVGALPVKHVGLPDGRLSVRKLDWTTGLFIDGMDKFMRTQEHDDVEVVSAQEFLEHVESHRARRDRLEDGELGALYQVIRGMEEMERRMTEEERRALAEVKRQTSALFAAAHPDPTSVDLAREDLRLRLRSGDVRNPGSRSGLVMVDASQACVTVVRRLRGSERTWRARPRPELMVELGRLLAAAGFPRTPPGLPLPPADATFRVLSAENGGATTNVSVTVKLPSSALDGLPAWRALFGFFDTIARQASGGELAIGDAAAASLLDRTF